MQRLAALVLVIGSVVAAGAALAGCGGGAGTGTSSGSPAPTGALARDREVENGRTVFDHYCATCHGATGGGGVGPAFTGGLLLHDFATADEQVAFVKRGKGVMPSFGSILSDRQVRAVVRYEREVLSVRP